MVCSALTRSGCQGDALCIRMSQALFMDCAFGAGRTDVSFKECRRAWPHPRGPRGPSSQMPALLPVKGPHPTCPNWTPAPCELSHPGLRKPGPLLVGPVEIGAFMTGITVCKGRRHREEQLIGDRFITQIGRLLNLYVRSLLHHMPPGQTLSQPPVVSSKIAAAIER